MFKARGRLQIAPTTPTEKHWICLLQQNTVCISPGSQRHMHFSSVSNISTSHNRTSWSRLYGIHSNGLEFTGHRFAGGELINFPRKVYADLLTTKPKIPAHAHIFTDMETHALGRQKPRLSVLILFKFNEYQLICIMWASWIKSPDCNVLNKVWLTSTKQLKWDNNWVEAKTQPQKSSRNWGMQMFWLESRW